MSDDKDFYDKEEPAPQSYFENDKDSISDAEKNETILKLARQYTQGSNTSQLSLSPAETNISTLLAPVSTGFNPFLSTDNPVLDPHSPDFHPRAWARHMLKVRNSDPERYPKLNAGVSFKGLGAYGYSDGSSYQPTVLTSVFQSAHKNLNLLRGRKGEKVTILRNFNGLVKSGETCVVLGRPGA